MTAREGQTEYFRKRYAEDPDFRRRRRESATKWTKTMWEDPAKRREYLRRTICRRYGLTPPELDAMDLICRICGLEEDYGLVSAGGRPKARLNMDHDHGTGKARKFLCGDCNRGLGCFKDDVALLRAAIEYLEEHDG